MSKNVFHDLGFNEDEAAGLKLKSYLFMSLQEVIRHNGMTQKEVAEAIGADQPKVSKILNGKFSEFSIERVAEYLQRLGHGVEVKTVPYRVPSVNQQSATIVSESSPETTSYSSRTSLRRLSLDIDADVLEFFLAGGPQYQDVICDVLRAHVDKAGTKNTIKQSIAKAQKTTTEKKSSKAAKVRRITSGKRPTANRPTNKPTGGKIMRPAAKSNKQ